MTESHDPNAQPGPLGPSEPAGPPPQFSPPAEPPGSPQWGPPQAEPAQWGPPPSEPQWGPPQGGPPQWGPPQGGPPQWGPPQGGPPQWGPPPSGWEQLGPPIPPPPTRRRRAPIIAAVVAAAVVGGGAATVVAMSDSDSGFKGAATPDAAVTSLVADLNKSDVLGILDHLPPGERNALLDPLTESINQAKRLHILSSSANASHFSGAELTADNIKFDAREDEAINDHVKIVKIVGGTLTLNSDLRKIPFARELVQTVFPGGVIPDRKSSDTVDLSDIAQRGGGLRVATQQVGGKWYPSLLYSIADWSVRGDGGDNPTAADYIAPKGASTPEDAVKQAVDAIAKQDFRRLIELAAPDELQVVHDYGGIILDGAQPDPSQSFTIKDLQLTGRKASGATRVSLKSVTVDTPGHETTVALNGNCVEVTYDGDYRKLCAGQVIKELNAGPLKDKPLTDAESAALGRLAQGVANTSIDVTETGGQWYVAALRSYFDITNEVVEPLQSNDLIILLRLMNR